MKKIILIISVFTFCLFFISGCACTSSKLNISKTIPAADGDVKFCKLKDGNTGIKVNIKYLASSQDITSQASNYVVWVQRSKEEPPQNVGMIKSNRFRRAKLKTKTPLQSFDLFITAEPSGQVLTPSGEPLLWTSYRS